MGQVFGSLFEKLETPKYEVLDKEGNVEVRKYAPYLVAEVEFTGTHFKNEADAGFLTLARYIGVFDKPQNVKAGAEVPEKIAMTAPVLTKEAAVEGGGEKVAMTAPVLTTETKTPDMTSENPVTKTTMQFVLPSKYTMETVPKPTDSRVKVFELKDPPLRGVITFSGNTYYRDIETQGEKLRAVLTSKGWKITGDSTLARFDPPWTPFFLRKNEVMFPVEKEEKAP